MRDGHVDAKRLLDIDRLAGPTVTLYIDWLHNDSVEKQQRVEDELKRACAVLVLKTPALEESPWVHREMALIRAYEIQTSVVECGAQISWASVLHQIRKCISTISNSQQLP